jgi:phenylpyruvate tautomerase PptA (4-oxalocrotonate tautomerase family)
VIIKGVTTSVPAMQAELQQSSSQHQKEKKEIARQISSLLQTTLGIYLH